MEFCLYFHLNSVFWATVISIYTLTNITQEHQNVFYIIAQSLYVSNIFTSARNYFWLFGILK